MDYDRLLAFAGKHYRVITGRTEELEVPTCKVIQTLGGVFNWVYIVEFEDTGREFIAQTHGVCIEGHTTSSAPDPLPDTTRVCIRIPKCGLSGSWTSVDEERIRSEASTMRFMSEHTTIPIPKVYAFGSTLNNALEVPYILMEFIEGRRASALWRDDGPLQQPSQKRLKILRGVAYAMSCLWSLQFDGIGTLNFDGEGIPVVSDTWLVYNDSSGINRRFERRSRSEKASHYFLQELEALEERTALIEGNHYVQLLRVIVEALPLQDDSSNVLLHPDPNLDNILVDKEGNVTGVLDWDGVRVVPAQLGWQTYPSVLRDDWQLHYTWPNGDVQQSLAPEDYDRYREQYQIYVREACGDHDGWRHTNKSHLYRKLFDALISDNFQLAASLVRDLLELVLPRVHERFLRKVKEKGLTKEEATWLRIRLTRLFEAETDAQHLSLVPLGGVENSEHRVNSD